eukprot:PLAT2990.1.p1 GENE.PLAT2990.1~~PLAT2990.1.p1  ORF type:complete len:129 (+),score=43.82 PLAT2990.1:1-387(+)
MPGKEFAFYCCGGVVSLTMLLLSSALKNNWYPMFVLIPLALIPLPNLFCSSIGTDPFSGETSLWPAFGHWLFGLLLTCVVGIPTIMLHVQIISSEAFFFVGGALLMLAFMWMYHACTTEDDEEAYGLM